MPTKFAMLIWLACLLADATAADLPAIRSAPGNEVPRCIRPAELMVFVNDRNRGLDPPRRIDPRFSDLGSVYQRIGACVQKVQQTCEGIRWDFAFFQMLIETNYLTFKKPDGSPGGVPPEDNNFAGVGATVAGKPGDKFKDIDTGVLAHPASEARQPVTFHHVQSLGVRRAVTACSWIAGVPPAPGTEAGARGPRRDASAGASWSKFVPY